MVEKKTTVTVAFEEDTSLSRATWEMDLSTKAEAAVTERARQLLRTIAEGFCVWEYSLAKNRKKE